MIDVLISGAGPAGAVAATVLARAGARVLVFDRARFPRQKLCGDTLNPGALAVLGRLGLASCVTGSLPIDGMIVTGASGVRIEGRYGTSQGRALSRAVFDAAMVSAARAAGARVEEGVLVQEPIVDRTGTVRGLRILGRTGQQVEVLARLVIAADGRYSRVARALGLSRWAARPRRWAIGAYFHNVAGLSSFGEMHVRRGLYVGVAPLPDGLANAVVVTASRGALGRGAALLPEVLESDPQLAWRFADASLWGPPVTLGPLAVDCTVGGAPGLLLAGDTAGFIDPMTGDGLRFALRGGELAAREALGALEHGIPGAHTRLYQARAREFGAKFRFNRALRALVGSPATVRAAGFGAAVAPALLREVICYAGDLGQTGAQVVA